jgi:hypothetical protein
MGKPDDIPEDVRALAAEFWRAPGSEQDAVARAILAERERCAQVCEAEKESFLSPSYAANQPFGSLLERFACDECAAAIRNGDHP